jgi:hypothetical protein
MYFQTHTFLVPLTLVISLLSFILVSGAGGPFDRTATGLSGNRAP